VAGVRWESLQRCSIPSSWIKEEEMGGKGWGRKKEEREGKGGERKGREGRVDTIPLLLDFPEIVPREPLHRGV